MRFKREAAEGQQTGNVWPCTNQKALSTSGPSHRALISPQGKAPYGLCDPKET